MDKYCVLPGREPVRCAGLDGNIIIIGETPRVVPEQFINEAKANGCLTEKELAEITARLTGRFISPSIQPAPVEVVIVDDDPVETDTIKDTPQPVAVTAPKVTRPARRARK